MTPDVATVEFTAKLKRAVRLHETYRVDCEVTRATSVRVWTRAEISDPKDGNVRDVRGVSRGFGGRRAVGEVMRSRRGESVPV